MALTYSRLSDYHVYIPTGEQEISILHDKL